MTKQQAYEKNHRSHHYLIHFVRLLILIIFLALWEITADKNYIDSFFFSSPSRILICMKELYQVSHLMSHIGITLAETMISFSLVLLVSMLTAMLLWYHKLLSEVLDPYLVILNSIPKSAMAPLFIVWLGTGMNTIIVAGISVAVFGAIISLYTAFRQTDPEKLKLITTLGGTKKDQLFKVVLPFNVPVILGTMKVNIGLALVGVIIGEFLAARKGLGYLIIYGSQVFKMSMVITSMFILCLIAVVLYSVLQILEHRYKKRGPV